MGKWLHRNKGEFWGGEEVKGGGWGRELGFGVFWKLPVRLVG